MEILELYKLLVIGDILRVDLGSAQEIGKLLLGPPRPASACLHFSSQTFPSRKSAYIVQ